MNNNIKLKRLEITRLFGYKDICIDFKDVTVLVGKNGLGKTTILKILNSLLTIDNRLSSYLYVAMRRLHLVIVKNPQ
ncbi:AAA family ATPase [Escherichia coli]